MDVTIDTVTAEIQREPESSPTSTKKAGNAAKSSSIEIDYQSRLAAARYERIRNRLMTY